MVKGTLYFANVIVQLRSGHYWLLLPASCFLFNVMSDDTYAHLTADSLFVAFWEKSGLNRLRLVM